MIISILTLIIFTLGCYYKTEPYNLKDESSKLSNYENVIVTLERTECYGPCPVYKLTIDGNGGVIYEGEKYVKTKGKKTSKISLNKVKELVETFYTLDYFSLNDSYYGDITDLATVVTSISINGTTKRVIDYYGAPERLYQIENKIDEVANSKQWIEKK